MNKRCAIVLVDGSDTSQRALEWACNLLAPVKDAAKLVVVSVAPPSLHNIHWLRDFAPLRLLPKDSIHLHVYKAGTVLDSPIDWVIDAVRHELDLLGLHKAATPFSDLARFRSVHRLLAAEQQKPLLTPEDLVEPRTSSSDAASTASAAAAAAAADKPADKPAESADKSTGSDKPADKPAESADKPAESADKPAEAAEKPAESADKPAGSDKPADAPAASDAKAADKPAVKVAEPAAAPALVAAGDVETGLKVAESLAASQLTWQSALEQTEEVAATEEPAAEPYGRADVTVVLGSRGLGRVKRILLGSVSDAVCRELAGLVTTAVIRPAHDDSAKKDDSAKDKPKPYDFVVIDTPGSGTPAAVAWAADHCSAGQRVLLLRIHGPAHRSLPWSTQSLPAHPTRVHDAPFIDETFSEQPNAAHGSDADKIHHDLVALAGDVAAFKRLLIERLGPDHGVTVGGALYRVSDDGRESLLSLLTETETATNVVMGTDVPASKAKRMLSSVFRGGHVAEYLLHHLDSTFVHV